MKGVLHAIRPADGTGDVSPVFYIYIHWHIFRTAIKLGKTSWETREISLGMFF